MSRYVPLSKRHHLLAGLLPAGFAHALEQPLIPLVVDELPQIMPHMLAAFTPAEGGGYQLVALQSLVEDDNVYLDGRGGWLEGYQPAWYRSHPFRMVPSSAGSHFLIYVDETSPAFCKEGGQGSVALFDPVGEYSAHGQRIVSFLTRLQQAVRLTQSIVAQLDEAGLIVSWTPRWSTEASPPGQPLGQLFHIDESRLRALPADHLASLARNGALSAAYAQLLSEHRLSYLIQRCETRWGQRAVATVTSDEDLFGGDDEVLRFDF